ncbi:sensor histidine kinase [Candidatus Woesearchaeota archaeon]|jgi:signal transduction histidine kinase|nr:sensor histidine kinase [Candidatus Woesearchaeota archaeon]
MKIKFKLAIYFMVVPLIIALVFGYTSFVYGSESIIERTSEHLESVAVLKENQFNSYLNERLEELLDLSEQELIVNYLNEFHYLNKNYDENEEEEQEAKVQKLLNERLLHYRSEEIFVILLNGKVDISTDNKQKGKIKLQEDYFNEGLKSIFVQSFYYSLSTQKPAITLSVPIKNENNVTIGVIAGNIITEDISTIMEEKSGLGETGETYLVNQYNLLVTKSRFIEELEFKRTIYTKAVKECLEGKRGIIENKNYLGEKVITFYDWIDDRDVCLIAEQGKSETFTSINNLAKILSIITGILFIISLLIGILFSNTISRPIIKLRDIAQKVGKGKHSIKIHVKSKDEIGDLAKTFNEMASDLKEARNELIKHAKSVEKEVGIRTKELNLSKKALTRKATEAENAKLATLNILEDVEEARTKLSHSYKKLKELDIMKSTFLTVTSHELKTPLTPAKIQTQMLLEGDLGKLNTKQKSSFNIILRNINRLNVLIEDILEISRLEAEGFKLQFSKVQLANLIKATTQNMTPVAEKKGITISYKKSTLPQIEADEKRIAGVITNLIENAIKFTDKGRISIEANKKGNKILVEVKDTGKGIAKEHIDQIFEAFFQIEKTFTREHNGTGLGLAISKSIVNAHKGKIWVRSVLGKGSTFYFTLPLTQRQRELKISKRKRLNIKKK